MERFAAPNAPSNAPSRLGLKFWPRFRCATPRTAPVRRLQQEFVQLLRAATQARGDGTAACALEALENAQRVEMLITRVRIPQGNQTASLWL